MKYLFPINFFRKNKNQYIIFFFVAVFTLLLLLTLKSAQQTCDSLNYVLSAKTTQNMFHPHHLLYTPIIYTFNKTISLIYKSCDIIFSAQIHNIIWAVITVLSFYLITKHLLNSNFISLLATIYLLITQGFWKYSTQVEAYIPTIGCLALITAIIIYQSKTNLTTTKIVIISLLLSVSIFYHQSSVLFCIPFTYYLIVTQKKKAWILCLKILSLTGIFVLLTYIFAFLSIEGNKTINNFLRFCLAYAFSPNPDWGNLSNISIAGINKLLYYQLWNLIALRERFNHNIHQIATYIFSFFFTIMIIWNIMHIGKKYVLNRIRCFLLLWLLTYFVFLLWWLPGEKEFFTLTLLPVLLLSFITLKDIAGKLTKSNSGQKIVAFIIISIITTLTINYKIFLYLHQSKSPAYYKASQLFKLAPQKCIICTDVTTQAHLKYYFNNKEVIPVEHVLLYLYQHKRLPEKYNLEKGECIIIPISYMIPEYSVANRVQTGINGYNNPKAWLKFMEWLFDFEYDSKGRLSICRKFRVIKNMEDVFILLLPSQIKVAGLNNFFSLIDNKINRHTARKSNYFQTWFANVYLMLE